MEKCIRHVCEKWSDYLSVIRQRPRNDRTNFHLQNKLAQVRCQDSKRSKQQSETVEARTANRCHGEKERMIILGGQDENRRRRNQLGDILPAHVPARQIEQHIKDGNSDDVTRPADIKNQMVYSYHSKSLALCWETDPSDFFRPLIPGMRPRCWRVSRKYA